MSPPKVSQERLDSLLPPELLDALALTHKDALALTHKDALALTHKVDAKNQIRLPGKLVFLCLLHNLLHHKDLTQRLLEETYQQKVGRHADHSSFGARLAVIKPAYFDAIFQHLYRKMAPTATKGDTQALKLRFVDATIVTLSAKLLTFGLLAGTCHPDKARRQVKSILELSDGLPQRLHVCTEKAEHCDSVAVGDTMLRHAQPGDLWIFDKGCNSRERLLGLHHGKSFFLTPHRQQNLTTQRVVFTLPPENYPTHPPGAGEPSFVVTSVQVAVFANQVPSQNKQFATMPLGVLEGLRFDSRTQQWKPLTLLSNLPVEKVQEAERIGPYTFEEFAAVYAKRWDIEVFFKFVKQQLNFSHLSSRSENGIRVMLYMSLIAALVLLGYKQESKIDRGWRSVKVWLAFDLEHWLKEAFGETFNALVDRHPCAARIDLEPLLLETL